jgi:hypothetical protein
MEQFPGFNAVGACRVGLRFPRAEGRAEQIMDLARALGRPVSLGMLSPLLGETALIVAAWRASRLGEISEDPEHLVATAIVAMTQRARQIQVSI